MNCGGVFVNNTKVRNIVCSPTATDILRKSAKQLEQIKTCKLVRGPDHQEKGSEYCSYAVKVKTPNEVCRAYEKLKVKYADATHISCAYHLENPFGPFRQEAIDDGDIGIGREMLAVLKKKEAIQIAIFLVRHYGGVHLGTQHFNIAESLASGEIRALNQPTALHKTRRQRDGSQDSFMSVGSALSQAASCEGSEDED